MSIIGTGMPRVDAPDKARGKAKYTADYSAPGMLRVALARAEVAHAVIRAIEVPELPEGVFCYTAKDLPSNLLPSIKNDQPVLAAERIRYFGEPFAVVAADTREAADEFASRIRLICDPLPVVEDVVSALEEESPRLFEEGNLCHELHSRKGDTETVFAACREVFSETFFLPVQTHAYLENESAFTQIDDQGRLALISSTQNAFDDRNTICKVLNLPPEQVTSRAAVVGGAFGGKDGNTAQIYAAIVTFFTRRPAQYIFSRKENIRCGAKRHSARLEVCIGFDGDGKMKALKGKIWLDTGAYALLGPAVLELGTEHMTGPYFVPNADLDGWLVYTNHTPASAMRGFGGTQAVLAVEAILDRAAERFGMSRLRIRKINALHRNQSGPMGAVMGYSFGFEEALDLLEKSDLYQEMLNNPEPGCGYGIGAALKSFGMGKGVPDQAVCEIERCEDGHFRVYLSLVDIGQGGETANVMMAAEALHVSPDRIEMCMGNSENSIDCGSTAASRCTYLVGNAILKAAEEIQQGKNYAKASLSFPEISDQAIHSLFASLAELAKVRIDPVSGAVEVCDVVNVTEAGRVINPVMMAGQIFGGIVMSVGYTLSEQIRYRDGVMLESGFDNYILPTALDAPHMVNINADVYEESGPFGAKGVGEASTIAIAPAILSAVRQLCPGLELTSLPIDREAILRYLSGKESV